MTALYDKLTALKLNFMAKELDTAIEDAARGNLSHSDMLDRLVDIEIDGRQSCAIARRFRLSKLQSKSDIADFDFDHDKSRRQLKGKITRLLDLDFIREGTNPKTSEFSPSPSISPQSNIFPEAAGCEHDYGFNIYQTKHTVETPLPAIIAF